MPFYQYYCEANQSTIEVNHPMSQKFKTWGEVCKHASIDPGNVSPDSPVIRLISKPMPIVWRLKGLDKDAPSSKLNI